MSKEVTVYGYNSVETSVLKNPENIIELYIDESSSNKRIEKLLSGKAASRLNILKVNKYLPGSRIPILAPASLFDFNPDYVIILPWNLATEIKNKFSKLADQGCKFITFVPKVKEI